MPENAAARIGPRSALPAPALGYEVAQVVKAAPTDPYSPTAAGPSKANDLMQSLGILDKTIAPLAIQTGEVWAGEQKKKGVQARVVGDALTPNASNAFIDGFERMDGTYKGIQFGNAAKEYAATNSHLKPDEFQKGLDALQNEYVGQMVHQGQMDTFLPDAIKGGEHATAIYQDAKNAQVMQERDQKVQEIQSGQMKLVLDQAAFDMAGIPLSSGFASTATDPEMRKKLMDNLEAFRAVVSPQLRKIHDDSRAAYKELGLTPAQIATKLVGTVGRLAGDTGVVAINDYMYQKDAAGQSPESANPELVNKLSDQARAMDTQINTAQRTNQERIDKKAADQRQAGWMLKLSLPDTTPEEAKAIVLAVAADPHIDPDTAWKIGTHATDIMLGQGFALKDTQSVARSLEDGIMTGQLVGKKAYAAIMDKSHSLSQPTYQHLMEKAHAIAEKKGDTAKDRSWAMFQSESGVYRSSLIKTLGVTDDTGKVMLGLDYSAQVKLENITADGVSMWYRGIERLAKAAPGGIEDNISGADLKTLHDRIVELHRPAVDAIVKTADQANGYGADQNAMGPPKPPKPGLIDRAKAALRPKPPAERPANIPAGYTPTGKTVGGKPAWVSPDGKTVEVEQ